MTQYHNPIVLQRADPWVVQEQGSYYFTGSHPKYDRIILRKADRIDDLQQAEEKTIWRKHESGPMSRYIWAPELHRVGNAWYIYFAAAQEDFGSQDLPTHRMYVLENTDDDPLSDNWVEKGQIHTPVDSFSLDATTEVIDGIQYLIWAQKDPAIEGNSNLYIAKMKNPWTLESEPVMLSKPEYDWECIDFKVNEGPAVLRHDGMIYLTYSASGTGVPYAVGMLTAKQGSDLLDPASWTKSAQPVFKTSEANHQYGPGHNSFTVSEDGSQDLMIYHARNYTQIEGDPLFDPNRHARVGLVTWSEQGPSFGVPEPDDRWTPATRDILPPDGSHE
ncbi:alpha-N-arabinofuranosidase [Bombiscardovia nodaiensis]|uniref:Alpha-N-arabinofuranosidase n=1 Tax=Bombiscardovia nodaiensis TaxID=2932181 RepID=A0ABN6S874_9BIFI|nr:alpha-N-arabinofuranosidase [Bombiscardovia nodaiensis]